MENKKLIMMFAASFSLVFAIVYYALFAMVNVSTTSISKETMYMNQVGLYREQKSIDGMMEALKKLDIEGYTKKQDDLQAVVCGVSLDETTTKEIQIKLTQANISFIEKSMAVDNEETLTLLKEGNYQEALERLGT